MVIVVNRLQLPEYPFPTDLKKVLVMLDKDPANKNNILLSEQSQVYLRILKLWEKNHCIEPTESQYIQLLKMALYLEEYQCKKDMRKYDLCNKVIIKTNFDTFHINADEWRDDEKPMIKSNDFIDVIDILDGKSYTLRIVKIGEFSIEAVDGKDSRFIEKYSKKRLYNVQFRYNNYPNRCNHFALWLIYQRNVTSYLFPRSYKQSLNTTTNVTYKSQVSKFYNSNIANNIEQKQAVLNILNKSSFPVPYILYGPPGTGKTAMLVEAICQILVQDAANNILVCTPSNTAADEVTKRLLIYVNSTSAKEIVYRMYSGSKELSTIDEKILPCCNIGNEKINTFIKYEDILRKRVVITTLCNCIKLVLMGLPKNHFSHVIIDEAGQSIEPDILIPVSLISESGRLHSQIVLAGDPMQLGPTVMSNLAGNLLGRSILERLMSYAIYSKNNYGKYNAKYITKLLINYRSHPDIIKISNELFYNNELDPRFNTGRGGKFPVIFYGVSGKEQKRQNSTSSFNRQEIDMVFKEINKLMKNKKHDSNQISQKDIGIVTPFKLQSKEIEKGLFRRDLKDINIGTVELFQGQERKIIIISTVRTKKFRKEDGEHIGSLSNPKRFNVAVTRAKDMLIVIGDPNALQTDSSWRYILKYCIANKSYYGVEFAFNSSINCTLNNSADLTLSSNVFKWKKFKIFTLDSLDSKTDVIETRRMILYPESELVRLPVYNAVNRLSYFSSLQSQPRWEPVIIPKERNREWNCAIL